MVNDQHDETLDTDDCPSPDELRAAHENRALEQRYGAHLADCRKCRERTDELIANEQVLSTLRALGSEGRITSDNDFGDAADGYTLVREIHRGGQGVVYEAREHSPARDVAIKVPLHGRWVTANQRRRFEREIDVIAGLRHPNIVTLFARGTTANGSDFFAMEYVRGQSLQELLEQRPEPMPVDVALPMFITICEAVEYAHQVGVIHRDVKPSNILVDTDDEPHLLDFGLAKLTDESHLSGLTVSGQFVGSLIWAAPEQVWFTDGESVSTGTDIYGLGLLLYRMVTGAHAYPIAVNPGQMIDTIRKVDPKRASSTRERGFIPHDLDAVLLKALEKRPIDRYQSVSDLLSDCRAVRDGKDVSVASYSGIQRLRRSARRHPWQFIGVAALLVLGLTLTLNGYRSGLVNVHSERLVTIKGARVDHAAGRSRTALQALLPLVDTPPPTAPLLGLESPAEEGLRLPWTLREIMASNPLEERISTLYGHPALLALDVHPSRDELLLASSRVPRIEVRSTLDLSLITYFDVPAEHTAEVQWSPSGEYLAIGTEDARVHVIPWRGADAAAPRIDLSDGATVEAAADRVAWTPESALVTKQRSGHGWLLAVSPPPFTSTTEELRIDFEPARWMFTRTTCYVTDGRNIANQVSAIDRASGALVGRSGPALYVDPDDRFRVLNYLTRIGIAHRVGDRWGHEFRVATNRGNTPFSVHPLNNAFAAEVRPHGGTAIYHLDSARERYALGFDSSNLRGLEYTHDGSALITLSRDGVLSRWSAEPLGSPESQFPERPLDSMHAGAYSADGATFVGTGVWAERAGGLVAYDTATRALIASAHVEAHSSLIRVVSSVVFHPHKPGVAFATCYDGTLLEWDFGAHVSPRVVFDAGYPLNALCVSPEGRQLAIVGNRSRTLIYDLDTEHTEMLPQWRFPDVPAELPGFEQNGRATAVRWVGERIIGCAQRGVTFAVDPVRDAPPLIVQTSSEAFRDSAVTADNEGIAFAGDDGAVRLFDTATLNENDTIGWHTCSVNAVAISPDGEFVASGDVLGHVKIWHLPSRTELADVNLDTEVISVTFSPDGSKLVVTGQSMCRVWDFAATDAKIARLGKSLAAEAGDGER